MKKIIKLFLISIFVFLFTIHASAKENEKVIHHVDTYDYCLKAADVIIEIDEINKTKSDTEIQEIIYKRALITVLTRDNSNKTPFDQWKRLGFNSLKIDFSQFEPVLNNNGYKIEVEAPTLTGTTVSKVTFLVKVVKEAPKQAFANITFLETNIPDMQIDITNGAVLYISDIEIPEKEGFLFGGWYLDKELQHPFLIPESDEYFKQEIKGDLTLYPKWIKKNSGVVDKPIESPAPPKNDVKKLSNSSNKVPSFIENLFILLVLIGIAITGGSVICDIRILRWNKKKKALRRMSK